MTEKQAIWKSILHWKRMIKWVEKQPPEDKASSEIMCDAIQEEWFDLDCVLCDLYYGFRGSDKFCEKCPLCKKHGVCSGLFATKKNAWDKVDKAKTWAGWLYHARRLLKQLESLRKPKGKKS